MEYIHIKNLEKYHPGYKDRPFQWAKISISMIQGDPDCELITNETDWARLIKFILLELKAKQPIPLDPVYLTRKGFDLKARPISLTINALQHFIETVTLPLRESNENVMQSRVEKSRVDLGLTPLAKLWNEVCVSLPEVREITDKRRKHEKARLLKKPIDQWRLIFERIEASDFCRGDSDSGWKATFDWVIKSDDPAVKVLEGKYDSRGQKRTITQQQKNFAIGMQNLERKWEGGKNEVTAIDI